MCMYMRCTAARSVNAVSARIVNYLVCTHRIKCQEIIYINFFAAPHIALVFLFFVPGLFCYRGLLVFVFILCISPTYIRFAGAF